MINIFIGYDTREAIAYHVLAHSIIRRSSMPVCIVPIVRSHLGGIHNRGRGTLETTEFSITRFLTPYLSDYSGFSIFLDCDMLCLIDISEVLYRVDRADAVSVVKHDYTPKNSMKFLNQVQTTYPKKNWSSMMVFNNPRCTALGLNYVEKASGLDLHRFNWLREDEVGALPLEYNYLVGEYEKIPNPKIVHFTNGGPWFEDYKDCDYADLWFEEKESAGF